MIPAIPWLSAAPYLVIAALLAMLAIGGAERRADKAALTVAAARFDRFSADIRATTMQARADDLANARRIETARSAVTQETARDLETKLAAARRDAADHARRLREPAAQAHPAGGGATDLPEPAGRAGGTAGPGGTPLLDDDIRICAENTVKAQGWQDWWAGQVAVAR